jgi:hypothetical protein
MLFEFAATLADALPVISLILWFSSSVSNLVPLVSWSVIKITRTYISGNRFSPHSPCSDGGHRQWVSVTA